MSILIGILSILSLIFLILATFAYNAEKKDWNNGFCKCGSKWEHFDNDSQGGRGYKCKQCDSYIWISYPIDK